LVTWQSPLWASYQDT